MDYPCARIEDLRVRTTDGSFTTSGVESLVLSRQGIANQKDQKHNGHFTRAGVRSDGFKKTGPNRPLIFNHRQISIIDVKSLEKIADGMEIDPDVTAELGEERLKFVAKHMGANIVTSNFNVPDGDWTPLHDFDPPFHVGSLELDETGHLGASVLAVSYNEPCVNPGRSMAEVYPEAPEDWGRRFKEVARDCRGMVGVTSCCGVLSVGSLVLLVELPKVPRDEAEA